MEKITAIKWEPSQRCATRWINIRVSSLVIFLFRFDTAANVFFLLFNLGPGLHDLFLQLSCYLLCLHSCGLTLTSLPDSSYHDFTILFHLKLPASPFLPPTTPPLFLFFLSQLNMLLYVGIYVHIFIYKHIWYIHTQYMHYISISSYNVNIHTHIYNT